jgi:hypothetical protein
MRPQNLLSWLVLVSLTNADRKAIPFGTPTLMKTLESQEHMMQRLMLQNKSLSSLSQSQDLHVEYTRHDTQQFRGSQEPSLTAVDDNGDKSWATEHDRTEEPEFSHNDAHTPSIFSLQRRTTQDCGIYRMYCADARSACNVSDSQPMIPTFDTIFSEDAGTS